MISPGTLNYSGSSEFCFASIAFQGTQAKAVQLLFRRRQVGPRKRWQAGVKESDMQRSCHACVCFALLKKFWIHLVCFSVWFLLIAVFDRQCVTPMVAEHSPALGAEASKKHTPNNITAASTEVKPQKKSRLASRAAWPAVLAMAGADDRESAWNVQLMFHRQIIGLA